MYIYIYVANDLIPMHTAVDVFVLVRLAYFKCLSRVSGSSVI